MMGEGELEKRINKMLFLSHAGKDLDDDYEQKRVHQIIEDAKKEFPTLDFAKPTQYAFEVNQQINAVKEWFIKYIGEK